MNFNFYQPSKIHFGEGRINELGSTVKKYGNRCLLVTTPMEPPLDGLFNRVIDILSKSDIEVTHFDEVVPNPSVEVIEKGFKLANENNVEVVVAVGGGSSIDTAKMIALTNGLETIDWEYVFKTYTSPFEHYAPLSPKGLPLVAVSTTSGTGSQVTQAAVISQGDAKNTVFHPDNFTKECIIDPELMVTLPPRITASTGFDAFSHAFESYINPRASRFTEIIALEAMELVCNNLSKVLLDGKNMEYRSSLAMADTLAGTSLANSGAAAPHPLGEIIGGVAHIPHGETLAIVFPAFIKQQWKNNIEKFAKVAHIFNPSLKESTEEIAAEKLYDEIIKFLETINLRVTLRDFKVTDEQLNTILNCPVLGYLPFGSKEDLQNIIKESF
ncbi:iron-containing alcohol dehydrogenase [Clostridium sp. KNHs214]|uniref:iron-containing alcohol dehydrogenase n=1 Tax=Clostridium sp. KNHs214 TaxID=1540257 RepID=UPI00055684DB|nr:iron-containing alcohol dehydrogenase [Clostridium sp. KNHs214]